MSDDLLRTLKQNPADQHAWAELYESMRPWVYSNCFQWLGNFADAEDATQKTFMHLAVHWKRLTFPDLPRLKKYLKQSAASRSIDLLRLRKRPGHRTDSAEETVDQIAGRRESHNPQSIDELIQYLDLAPQQLAALSERQKELLWLSYLGYSSSEISTELQVSERTVRRELSTIRRLIR